MSIKNNRSNNNIFISSENNFIYGNKRIFSRDHLSNEGLFPTIEGRNDVHKKFFQNTNNSDIFFQSKEDVQSKSRNLSPSSKKYFKTNESDIFFQSPDKSKKNVPIKGAKKNISTNLYQSDIFNTNNNKQNNINQIKEKKKNLRDYESDIFFQKEDKNKKKQPIKSSKKNNSKIGKDFEEKNKIEGKKILKKSNESDVFFQHPDKNKKKVPINNQYKNKSNVQFTYTNNNNTNKSINLSDYNHDRENSFSPIKDKLKIIKKRTLGKSGSAQNINYTPNKTIKVNRLKKQQSEKFIKYNRNLNNRSLNGSTHFYKTELLNNDNLKNKNSRNSNNSVNKLRSITQNVPSNKSIDWINFRTDNYNRQEYNENYNKTKGLSAFNKKINDFIGNLEPEKHVKLENQKLNKYKFLSNMFNENQDNLNEIRTLFKDYNNPRAHITKIIENFSNFYGKENFKEKIRKSSANSTKNHLKNNINFNEDKFEIKNIKPEDANDIIKELNKNGINVYDINYINNSGSNFHDKENIQFKIGDNSENINKMKDIVKNSGKTIKRIKNKTNFPKTTFKDKNLNINPIGMKKNIIRSGNNHNFSDEFNKVDNRYKNNFGKSNFIKY